MKNSAYAFLFAGLAAAAPALAVDGYLVEAGANGDIQSLRVGMIRQWDQQWFADGHWQLTGYWEGSAAVLNSDGANGKIVANLGLTPVFRFRPNALGGAQPYWDIALGLHLLSDSKIDDQHDLGSALQLVPLVGVGVTFGEKSQYDLGYRFQHYTNAGLKEPDDGLSLHQVRLTYLY
jgi:hypothetical protein